MSEPMTFGPLSPREAEAQIGTLSAVLMDCVEGGASVSFMAPLTHHMTAAAKPRWANQLRSDLPS